jgi:peptidoglycan L-alanyl-D-glutamate endopeptidase CwlK
MQKKYKWLILIGGIGGVILIFIKRKSIMEYTQGKVWDVLSETRINTLHPKVRDKAREFINKAEKQNIKLRVSSAYRNYAEQNELYAQGRTKAGSIVTNAKGGQSSHNFGTAIDVVPIVNGKADWNTDWNKIAVIGKSVGFSWGGDWTSFKDKPHFEMNFGNTLAQLRAKYDSGKLTDGYVQLA